MAARMVNNEVHIYAGGDIAAGITNKLRQPYLMHFSVAPGSGPMRIATFVPEIKGKTAGVYIYQVKVLIVVHHRTCTWQLAHERW